MCDLGINKMHEEHSSEMFKLVCGHIEDSDQFAHLCSLIIVLNEHSMGSQVSFFSHKTKTIRLCMRGSRNFCQRRSDLITFLVDEGIEDRNTAINGPSSAPPAKRHLNDVSLAGR